MCVLRNEFNWIVRSPIQLNFRGGGEHVKAQIEKKIESYAKQAKKERKKVVFEPSDWVWVHMRKERFPEQRKSKLQPRGDRPFQVLERINENFYKIRWGCYWQHLVPPLLFIHRVFSLLFALYFFIYLFYKNKLYFIFYQTNKWNTLFIFSQIIILINNYISLFIYL